MNSTKKMPCGLSKDGRLTQHSEFVIPHTSGTTREGFRGLSSGKIYREAAMTYIGREITSEDIIGKLPESDRSATLADTLDSFIAALTAFKIGNVIGIDYDTHDGFALSLVRQSAQVGERKKLP